MLCIETCSIFCTIIVNVLNFFRYIIHEIQTRCTAFIVYSYKMTVKTMSSNAVVKKTLQVESVSNLSFDEFQANYFSKEKPVLIENGIEDWPARKWTLKSLNEKAGHNTVFVRQNTSVESYRTGKSYSIESMKFSTYIENIEQNNRKAETTYLAVQNIKKALPELEADLQIPVYIEKVHLGPYLWLARQGHYEFCHFDPDDNFLIVLSGQKVVRLYPAAELERLYPNALGSKGKTIQSNVNCDDPDLTEYPKFRDATCYEVCYLFECYSF